MPRWFEPPGTLTTGGTYASSGSTGVDPGGSFPNILKGGNGGALGQIGIGGGETALRMSRHIGAGDGGVPGYSIQGQAADNQALVSLIPSSSGYSGTTSGSIQSINVAGDQLYLTTHTTFTDASG